MEAEAEEGGVKSAMERMTVIDPREANLLALRRLTSDILEAADSKKIDDAVNWGDLKCYCAERCEDEDGCWTLRVYIDEAAPDAYRLHEYVTIELEKHGYKNVAVHTEW